MRIWQNYIDSRKPVGGDIKQVLVVDIVTIAHLAAVAQAFNARLILQLWHELTPNKVTGYDDYNRFGRQALH